MAADRKGRADLRRLLPLARELEELHTVTQAPLHHSRVAHHLFKVQCNVRRTSPSARQSSALSGAGDE
jgi:hypothetical protein